MKHIKCKTKEQMKKVLGKLEKDGYRWAGGRKPTEYDPFNSYKEDTVIEVDDKRMELTYCSYGYFVDTQRVKTFIDADDFVRDEKSRPSIVIFRRDRNVIAKNVATGNEGIAKCSPNDDFVFKTGASIALARLMAKTPEVLTDDVKTEWKKALGIADTAKPEAKFKVGDYVTLKEGLDKGGRYGALTLHSGRMYEYANGKRLEVETATFSECDEMYHYRCKGADGNYFYYTEAMLDKCDESKIYEGDTVKVINTGLNYSSYPQWVGKYISDPDMAARYYFTSPDTHKKYKVIKIAEHEDNGRTLAYIEEIDGMCFNSCYLIEVKGLEKV